mmetsp:Transcript_42920/g.50210  ORF Transcript_42920/g.50210 Transcript_42920/m.50210 type:complete len:170 (+) Transcript_42920:869-1378(+)
MNTYINLGYDPSASIPLSLMSMVTGECFEDDRINANTRINSIPNYPTWSIRYTLSDVDKELVRAIDCGDLEHLKYSIKSGGNTNLILTDGRTPLHIAAGHRSGIFINIVVELLRNGAHTEALDNKGRRAIDLTSNPRIGAIIYMHKKRMERGKYNQRERRFYMEALTTR